MKFGNPLAWLLAALLVVAVYGNYTVGHQLTTVCDLMSEPLEWHVGGAGLDGDLDAVMKEVDQLSKEGSLRGDLYRWQTSSGRQIERICSGREADNDLDQ